MKNGVVSLDAVKTIAFIMSPRLGDSLLSMIVAHNLRRNGFKVTAFNNYLASLNAYFPEEDIQPYPDQASSRKVLSSFDLLIYYFKADYERAFATEKWHSRVVVLDDSVIFRRPTSMVNVHQMFCREIFGLNDVVKENGFRAIPGLKFRHYGRRVVIHPSAFLPDKQWLASRFFDLAQRLKAKNYQPVFVISPTEQEQFSWIAQHGLEYVADPDLQFLPGFLYESGWFIGNDSGVGHLASNFGIPTITLLGRKSIKRRWRPGWAPGEALTPWVPLFLPSWKKHYWKYCISVARVIHTLDKLNARFAPENELTGAGVPKKISGSIFSKIADFFL